MSLTRCAFGIALILGLYVPVSICHIRRHVFHGELEPLSYKLYNAVAKVTCATVKTVHEHVWFCTFSSILYMLHKKGYEIADLSNMRWADAALVTIFVAPVVKTATQALLDDNS
ncbi:hypothetical protein Noda2021_06460 [Candidatus Dependentiae bacterium Noda2021]|nr:hypothetical protein Noda2021_06460 [Candidatus Dependentiae bacterium Noda2021]